MVGRVLLALLLVVSGLPVAIAAEAETPPAAIAAEAETPPAVSAAAEVETLQVVITVTDGKGNAAVGAEVSLIPSTSAGAALAQRKTAGANGEAVFERVPVGPYHMDIRADGYAPLVVMRFAVSKQSVEDGAVRGRFKLAVMSAPPAPPGKAR